MSVLCLFVSWVEYPVAFTCQAIIGPLSIPRLELIQFVSLQIAKLSEYM